MAYFNLLAVIFLAKISKIYEFVLILHRLNQVNESQKYIRVTHGKIPIEQLPQVCDELRQNIIDELADNPGHFASSLGVVELTVALHYVYDTPYDRIVWDVGHQAYGHKILTGRREMFHTNRKLNGLKPFPSPSESEYDTFTADMHPTLSPLHWEWPLQLPTKVKRNVTLWQSLEMVQ